MNIGVINISFDKANLRNMRVGKVIHKAFVAVNEEGTEAAAVAVLIVLIRSFTGPSPSTATALSSS